MGFQYRKSFIYFEERNEKDFRGVERDLLQLSLCEGLEIIKYFLIESDLELDQRS